MWAQEKHSAQIPANQNESNKAYNGRTCCTKTMHISGINT